MITLFTPMKNHNSTGSSTRGLYGEYSTLFSHQPTYQFSDVQLTHTLALIRYISQCGYTEFDSIHIVLARFRKAIEDLLKHCARENKLEYSEFVHALLVSFNMVTDRLIIPAVNNCSERAGLSLCHLIIKEVYNLVKVFFSFTNLINLNLIFAKNGGPSAQHRLHVSSRWTIMFLEATHKFQIKLLAYNDKFDAEAHVESLLNVTVLELYSSTLVYAMEFTSKLICIIIANIVPTNIAFLYFKDILSKENVSITDVENFEEFITRFLKVDELAAQHKSTPLYDVQKGLTQTIFLEIIFLFPVNSLLWCTLTQAANYLQVFIGVYNRVYHEDLTIERVWSPVLNVERIDTEQEKNMVTISNAVDVPLDSYFDGPDTASSVAFSPRQPEKSESNVDSQIPSKAPESNLLVWAIDYIPTEKIYGKVLKLNEFLALDIQQARTDYKKKLGHKRGWFQNRTCFRCKYIPWHKHKFPE